MAASVMTDLLHLGAQEYRVNFNKADEFKFFNEASTFLFQKIAQKALQDFKAETFMEPTILAPTPEDVEDGL